MDNNGNKPKCESCGVNLVESRKFIASTHMYWNRPWGSAIKMSSPVIPHACPNCGRVFLFLGDRNRILREFNQLPDDQKNTFLNG